MIKLLRNIRKKLIKQSKVRNYFIYAIGEIILVVIGILIALQINNWNGVRKDREKEQLFLQKLSSNLSDDIISLENIINSDSLLIQDLNKLMNEILTVEDPKELSFDNNSRYKYSTFSANTSLYDNMISTGQIGLFRNDSIFDALTDYYKNATKANNGLDASIKKYSGEIESFYVKFDHYLDDEKLPKKTIVDYRNEPFVLNSLWGKRNLIHFK